MSLVTMSCIKYSFVALQVVSLMSMTVCANGVDPLATTTQGKYPAPVPKPSPPPPPSAKSPSSPPPAKSPSSPQSPSPPKHSPPPTPSKHSPPPSPTPPKHSPPPSQTPPKHSPPPTPPPAMSPSPPPKHSPHWPPVTRTLFSVQGVVYCKSCKYLGSNTLMNATALSGAKVKLVCNNTKRGVAIYGKTDKNGYFLIKAPKTITSFGAKKCRVFLVSSPLASCKKPTDLQFGLRGARLRVEKKFDFSHFTVGPFAFAPAAKCHHGPPLT
ncbi:hypothetical protein GIB67_037852 [Kingdonia uniflora]|uniref:Pistil-specific extensin-like protein n=1 Tax=Kingdonia uniflora TaxID=39325 RepID=A0A7J7LH90_9MAGN|nr:hypothetical protein GIB67_037852 [Kingdonia uniflora]